MLLHLFFLGTEQTVQHSNLATSSNVIMAYCCGLSSDSVSQSGSLNDVGSAVDTLCALFLLIPAHLPLSPAHISRSRLPTLLIPILH